MKILITGGAGFIGSAMVRYIINETEDSVINVDKLTYAANLYALKSVENSHRYTFERVDICDKASLERVFRQYQPDAVMHLAAESHVDRSIDSAGVFIHQNMQLWRYQYTADNEVEIQLNHQRNYWLQVVKGSLNINGESLQSSDAIAIRAEDKLVIKTLENVEFLLFDLA